MVGAACGQPCYRVVPALPSIAALVSRFLWSGELSSLRAAAACDTCRCLWWLARSFLRLRK